MAEDMIERERLQDTGPMQELHSESIPEGHQIVSGGAAGGGRVGSGEKPHLGRKIALGAASLLAAAGIVFGVDRAMNNGDDDPERGAVTEPTSTPTVEATPTKEPAKVEKSPYEFGFSQKVGDVTVQITKQTQERTECPDPESAIKSAKMVPCNPTHEIVVNKDVFPDAEERIEEVFKKGIYYAWQRADQSRTGVTYEEYLQRVDNGEDMSIKARGFQGSSFLPTEITISPTDEFFYDTIHEPISIIRPWTSLGVGYREVVNKDGKKEFHLEIFDFTAGGVGSSFPEVAQFSAGNLMAVGLSYLGFPDIQKSGTFITPAQNEASGAVVVPLRNIVFQRVNNSPYSILGAK